jgi:tyrosinase
VTVKERTGGDIHVRQEIRQLEQDQDMWTLYILGLSMLQFTAQSSPTSWYSIAGLHHPPLYFLNGIHSLPPHTRYIFSDCLS